MRKGGIASAPCTPKGGSHGRGGQPTKLAEEHYIVTTTFVKADVSTFRELVQKLTGNPTSPLPRTLECGSPTCSTVSNGPDPAPVRQDNILAGSPDLERIMSVKPVRGPGPERKSTAKLLERRQNAKKLELKQLMGPHILKRTMSPALSPVSPLTGFDLFAEQNSISSPIVSEITGSSSVGSPRTTRPSFDLEQLPAVSSSPDFDLNVGVLRLEERCSSPDFDLNVGVLRLEERCAPSPREPHLLTLFPLHSPRSLRL